MAINNKSKTMLFPRIGKSIIIFVAIAFIIAGIIGYRFYMYAFKENATTDYILLIPDNASYNDIFAKLKKDDVLINYNAFKWVAKKKNYPENVKQGRYKIEKGMNTNQIVNKLIGGLQDPVNVTFNNLRFNEDLAGRVSKYLQADSVDILGLFQDTALVKKYGFTPETFRAMFIPNTYEFYWTTSAGEFADRMKKEYERFWTEERREKAAAMNLKPEEVITLASIVQSETAKKDELKRVAGLYVNRLQKGMLLQADPTVKYAVGDFSLRRILYKHLEIDSPYNTYKYAGLPPGPINFPETSSINAVLDYEDHKYIYMAAKEDFSGYHNFASTLTEHNRNAAKYQRALNEKKIYK